MKKLYNRGKMTTKPISEMTDQEIDSALAEMMGWDHSMGAYWELCGETDADELVYLERDWHPHDDLNQVWECEEKIIKLGLVEKYSRIICGSVSVIQGKTMLFNIMHSTARQRCKAMLMTMMDHGNKVVHE